LSRIFAHDSCQGVIADQPRHENDVEAQQRAGSTGSHAAHEQEAAACDEGDVTEQTTRCPFKGMERENGPTRELAVDRDDGATARMSTASSSASPATSSARRSKAPDRVTGRDDGQLSLDFDGGPPLPPALLTELQVCRMLNIGRTTLRSIPELRPKHIGRCVRYLLSDVERYIAELT
jgi:hypothetical protein